MSNEAPVCKPALHVWRRPDGGRGQSISPQAWCDCLEMQFERLSVGDWYDVAYIRPDGTFGPSTGPRKKGPGTYRDA